MLGLAVVVINVAIYVIVFRRASARASLARHAARPGRTLSPDEWR